MATLIGVLVAFLNAALFRRWGVTQAIDRLLKIDAQEMKRLNPLSLVDSGSFFVAGYFEETKLGKIRTGDTATI